MSKTNQVCICCEARDNCPYYDSRRTVCVPVKCTDWEGFSTIQDTTDWQYYRIQASIAAMQGLISGGIYTSSTIRLAQERGQSGTEFIAQMTTEFADDLIAELQKKKE